MGHGLRLRRPYARSIAVNPIRANEPNPRGITRANEPIAFDCADCVGEFARADPIQIQVVPGKRTPCGSGAISPEGVMSHS